MVKYGEGFSQPQWEEYIKHQNWLKPGDVGKQFYGGGYYWDTEQEANSAERNVKQGLQATQAEKTGQQLQALSESPLAKIGGYQSLLDYSAEAPEYTQYLGELPKYQKTFKEAYTQPSYARSEQSFQDYLSKIAAPGSTEEVRKQIESTALQQTLADIDRDTAQQIASIKSEMMKRGIGNPGQTSDIEQVAIAQAGAAGGRTKAQARTQLSLAEIERQAKREEAVRGAYGQRYGISAEQEARERGYEMQGTQQDVQTANQLMQLAFTTGVQTEEQMRDRQQRAQELSASLSSTEKQNVLNNLYKMLLAQAGNDVEREKIQSQFDIAILNAKTVLDEQRMRGEQAEKQKGDFWTNIWQGVVGGVTVDLAKGFGRTFGESLGSSLGEAVTS